MSYLTLYLTILFLNFSILSFPQVESTPRGLCEQYIQQSEEQFTINETEKGKKLLKKAIIVDPTYYKPHFKLGFYYHEERLYKLASRELYIAKDKYEAEYNIKSFNVWYHDVLLLLGESELQLDRYEEALEVFNKLLSLKHSNTGALERVAWIYYKLKQYDKSRRMIKECLAIDDKDGGCLNISGILYSKNREYHKAIENYNMANFLNLEVKNNNIGEAYKSLFLYDKAKSYYMQVIQSNTSFLYALTHLNLSDIYINGLNLNQAKKILNDYEVSSFGAMKQMQTSSIQDLGFIYLYLAKVNYYSGNMKEALSLLKKAQDYPQHFGSIGYTKNHYNYLIYYMLSLVTKSLVYYEEENIDQSFIKRAFNLIDKLELLIQSWWYMRKAAEISVVKLNRIEDLYIHNTEAIFDYANLSEMLRMYDVDVIFNKLKILSGLKITYETDKRNHAKGYYYLYLGHLSFISGYRESAKQYLNAALTYFNEDEKTLKIKAYSILAELYKQEENQAMMNKYLNSIYLTHPPYIRIIGKRLPVFVSQMKIINVADFNDDQINNLRNDIMNYLSRKRFQLYDIKKLSTEERFIHKKNNVNYNIEMKLISKENNHFIRLSLIETTYKKPVCISEEKINIINYDEDIKKLVNSFSKRVFQKQ